MSASESVSSRSRKLGPVGKVKAAHAADPVGCLYPRSISLSATAGCQRSWPLKSRKHRPDLLDRRLQDRASDHPHHRLRPRAGA